MSKSTTAANRETRIYRVIDEPTDIMTVGFAFRTNRVSNNNLAFFAMGKYNDSTGLLKLKFNANKIRVFWNDVSIADTTRTFAANTWYVIECKMRAHATDGFFKMKIDVTDTQVDLTSRNFSVVDGVLDYIHYSVKTTDVVDLTYNLDDVYVLNGIAPNNDFLGMVSILGGRTNDYGDYTDFDTVGAPTAWEACREYFGDLSTYVKSDLTGARILFGMDDVPDLTNSSIVGMQVNAYVSKEQEFGPTAKYKLIVRSDGTSHEAADHLAVFDWESHQYIFEKDPITDTTWTVAKVNGTQLGLRVTQLTD